MTSAARIVLRALRPDDAATVLAYRRDPEVARYQMWHDPTLAEIHEMIQTTGARKPFTLGGWSQLAITLRAGGELIGDLGVNVLADEPRQAQFGITLAPAAQGRGYATEALRALLATLFDELGMHRVFASVDPRNARSVALMRRAGFRREAHLVESMWFKGAWADDLVFAMLAREWEHHRASR